MNGRLVLLIVATGLFVRLWLPAKRTAADERTTNAATAAPRMNAGQRCVPGDFHAAAFVQSVVRQPPASHQICMAHSAPDTAIENWTLETAPISLPRSLEPGLYRVVDQSGRVATLEVPAASPGCRNFSASTPEFFVVREGAANWYFVRLSSTPAVAEISTPAAGSTPCDKVPEKSAEAHPQFTNRKFDFSGYANEVHSTESLKVEEPSPDRLCSTSEEAERHTALRVALIQRDAERWLRDMAQRMHTWWERKAANLPQAGAASLRL